MQGSDVADTVLVLTSIETYGTDSHTEAITRAKAAAQRWLAETPLVTQEDRIWRLRGWHALGGDHGEIGVLRKLIADSQNPDGGWGAGTGLVSEAFSTGQTLYTLCETGMEASAPVAKKARDFLLHTQLSDGSWLVESTVEKKAQPYFENGDPHGEDQFLSIAGTAWATAALARWLRTAVVE